jgi:hypothetical protein
MDRKHVREVRAGASGQVELLWLFPALGVAVLVMLMLTAGSLVGAAVIAAEGAVYAVVEVVMHWRRRVRRHV